MLHCETEMNVSRFGVKGSKVKVTVECSMLETALLAFRSFGQRHTVLNDLTSSYIHLV